MRFAGKLSILVAGGVSLCGVASADLNSCSVSPQLVGECFIVHGRLSSANGNPTFRIWRIGSRRILGVFNSEGADIESPGELPPEILSVVPATGWDRNDIYGDFTLCPLEQEKPGWMQFVCIADATHLVSRPR